MIIPVPVLMMSAVIALLGIGTLVAQALERKRRAAYEEYSLIRGFRFEAERPDAERGYRSVFDPFTQGRRHQWGCTISGTRNGMLFTAFEYRWVTGGGKNSSRHVLSAILWEQEGAQFPKFAIGPEGWFSRLAQRFGMQDIDFPDSIEFSQAYRLHGADEPGIRALFTPEKRQFFAATPDQNVAGGGKSLFWWRSGRLPKPEEFDEWLERGDQVRRRFFKQ